ncbi:hypothetical protein [Methanotorris formicicus]|uniref:Abortive infection protein n=1 Tax=Methanotorris formicicus Mc-S-70 TaxID=647171 RepID=H1L1F3_9EURY|nr:hypothetical protein [Methanotorris formicicus]EHP83768.1 abortive infection protein [Methanotorris formicicus Mc-S-70]
MILELIKITATLFMVLIYWINLIEALKNRTLKNFTLKFIILYTSLMIFLLFFIDFDSKFLVLTVLFLSVLVLIDKRIFKLFVGLFKMNLQWRFLHRVFFSMSFYVLLNPIRTFANTFKYLD